jgi:predicted Zn-dependent peptidase
MFFNRIVPVDEIIQNIRAVTVSDIERVARKLFSDGFSSTVVVGPVSKGEAQKIFDK